MTKALLIRFLIVTFAFLSASGSVSAQRGKSSPVQNAAIAQPENLPVLVKHLPDWENARNRASYILKTDGLQGALGERPVFDLIDFSGGTEAVAAGYPQGKLLIVEYSTPQASIDADNKIKQRLSEIGQNAPIFYRRIGNYNAFVFDAPDEASASFLLDQVKYEKEIQWLGTDPFLYQQEERAFIRMTGDLFLSTVLAITGGIGLSVIAGIIVGIVFFYRREQNRAGMETFSDAGGMTRLNLDGLTPQTSPDRLLGK